MNNIMSIFFTISYLQDLVLKYAYTKYTIKYTNALTILKLKLPTRVFSVSETPCNNYRQA